MAVGGGWQAIALAGVFVSSIRYGFGYIPKPEFHQFLPGWDAGLLIPSPDLVILIFHLFEFLLVNHFSLIRPFFQWLFEKFAGQAVRI